MPRPPPPLTWLELRLASTERTSLGRPSRLRADELQVLERRVRLEAFADACAAQCPDLVASEAAKELSLRLVDGGWFEFARTSSYQERH